MRVAFRHDGTEPAAPAGTNDSAVVLRAARLKKAFGGAAILDGIDLTLRQGEVVLLRGENGSGKTTLLNVLTGNVEPDAGTIEYRATSDARSFRFSPWSLRSLNPFSAFAPEYIAGRGFGRTWQEVRLFRSHTLRDNIVVAHQNQPGENPFDALVSPASVRRHELNLRTDADRTLTELGLGGRELSTADKISLGQSKRVAIARAVAAGARVLFLDEPLAGLDRDGITEVIHFLERLVREKSVTLVVVEHVYNQAHFDLLATTDWHLVKGKLLITRGVAGLRQGRYAAPPTLVSILARDGAEVVEESLPRGALLTRIRRKGVLQGAPKAVLEVQDLVVRRGPRNVVGLDDEGKLSGFNLALGEGEIAVLQAPNAWGKTSLLMSLAGLIPVSRGRIRQDGKRVEHREVWERARLGMRYVESQGLLFPSLTIAEVERLSGARGEKALSPGRTSSQTRISDLSSGQRQLLSLSATKSGRVHLFDEPLSGLDANSIETAIQEYLQPRAGCVLIAVPFTT